MSEAYPLAFAALKSILGEPQWTFKPEKEDLLRWRWGGPYEPMDGYRTAQIFCVDREGDSKGWRIWDQRGPFKNNVPFEEIIEAAKRFAEER